MFETIDQIFVLIKHWLLGYVPGMAQPLISAILSVVPVVIAFPLLFAGRVGLLVRALYDVNALGRTFLLADLAGHTTQSGLRIRTVIYQEREVTRCLDLGQPLFWKLNRRESVFVDVTAEEIACSLGQALHNTFT